MNCITGFCEAHRPTPATCKTIAGVAGSVALIAGGIFLFLAAHQVLPAHANVCSNLAGYIGAGVLTVVGIAIASTALFCHSRRKTRGNELNNMFNNLSTGLNDAASRAMQSVENL